MAGGGRPFAVCLGEQRGRAGNEQAHVLRRLGRQPLVLQQAYIERRHAHHRRGARHETEDLVGVELGHEDHRRARQQDEVCRHKQPVRVEDRQRVEQHVVGRELPRLQQRVRVGGKVIMRQHRAFRATGGAGRVENRGEIVAGARHVRKFIGARPGEIEQRAVRVRAQCLDCRDAELVGDGGQGGLFLRRADDDARLGVANEVFELGERVAGVERQVGRAGAQAGEIEQDGVGGFLDLHGDAVAGLDAAGDERIGDAPRLRDGVRRGDLAAVRRLNEDSRGIAGAQDRE